MSNNRKRNMRKLARNIITGTALAVGGLTQTSANETIRTEQESNTSGGMNAGTIASLGVTAAVGTASLISGYMQHKSTTALTQQGQDEVKRHNKNEEERQDKKDARDKELTSIGTTEGECRDIANNMNYVFRLNRSKRKVKPDDIQQLLKKGATVRKIVEEFKTPGGGLAFSEAQYAGICEKMGKELIALKGVDCVKAGAKWLADRQTTREDMESILVTYDMHNGAVGNMGANAVMWNLDTTGPLGNLTPVSYDKNAAGVAAAAGVADTMLATVGGAAVANPITNVKIEGSGTPPNALNLEFGNMLLPESAREALKDLFPASLMVPRTNDADPASLTGLNANAFATRSVIIGKIGGKTAAEINANTARNNEIKKGNFWVDIVIGSNCNIQETPAVGKATVPLNLSGKNSGSLGPNKKTIGKSLGNALVSALSNNDTKNVDAWVDDAN